MFFIIILSIFIFVVYEIVFKFLLDVYLFFINFIGGHIG